jgi:hypothetical protein
MYRGHDVLVPCELRWILLRKRDVASTTRGQVVYCTCGLEGDFGVRSRTGLGECEGASELSGSGEVLQEDLKQNCPFTTPNIRGGGSDTGRYSGSPKEAGR